MSIWPPIIMIGLHIYSLGISMERHGKKREVIENAWVTAIAIAVGVSILWWGGFFEPLMSR